MKLIELNSILRMYECNFRNLHWNASGENFDGAHKSITTEYYEMIGTTIDETAEIIAMLGQNAPNYIESIKIIEESKKYHVIIDSSKLYTRKDVIHYADIMLNDICELLTEVLEEDIIDEDANAGIKSKLEDILYDYTLQARYINKRRTM